MTREEVERTVGSRDKNIIIFLNDVVDKDWRRVEKYMQEHYGLSASDIKTVRTRLVVERNGPYEKGTGYWKPGESTDGDKKGPLGLAKDDNSGREREQKVMTD